MAQHGYAQHLDAPTPDVVRPPEHHQPGLPAIDPDPTTAVAVVTSSDQPLMRTLVTRAQNGDREAFAAIYDRYVDGIYRYLYYRTLSPQLAEDLTSETFIRALRSVKSFRWEGRDLGAWLVTIARNLTADYYKSSRYRRETVTDDLSTIDQECPSVEGQVLTHLDNQHLMRVIGKLKPEQRECITLRFLQEMSLAETATVMQRTQGAIKQLQFRAIRALARLLENDSADEWPHP